MRIALIHYRLLRNGGLETRLFNYLRFFVSQGHDVHLIVSKIDPSVQIDRSITIHQVDLKRVPKPIRMWFFNSGLKKIMNENSFDLSLSLGRTSHQDLVLCPGNHLGYLKAIDKTFWSLIDLMNIYLDWKAYSKSRLVLACSTMMKNELVDFYKTNSLKTKVLLPPIDVSKFRKPSDQEINTSKEKFGISPEKKSLLFLTTGNERKGYPLLLNLMKAVVNQPIELIVAGVKPINSALPNVKYVGYAEEPQELFWACDGLIHPAKYEPFGQVVTESIQCHTPVLVSNMVGAQEIVNEKVGIIVNSLELEDWRNAVLKFVNEKFEMEADFAQKRGLTVEQHCNQIIDYAEHKTATL